MKVSFAPSVSSDYNNTGLKNQNTVSSDFNNISSANILSAMDKMSFCQKAQVSFGNNKDLDESAKQKADTILRNEKDKYGVPRFNKYKIDIIKDKINSVNIEFLEPLLAAKECEDAQQCFVGSISKTLESINSVNKSHVMLLLSQTKDNGAIRFQSHGLMAIHRILNSINETNTDLVPLLVNAKNEKGEPRFYVDEIVEILGRINKENKDYVEPLINAKDGKDRPLYSVYTFANDILPNINEINAPYVQSIVDADCIYQKENNENSILPKKLLCAINENNGKYLATLLNLRDKDGKLFDSKHIVAALEIFEALGDKITINQEAV